MTALTFPAETAAAIRALVLPASLIANSAPLDRCPCQYGRCQHCVRGRHGRCQHSRLTSPPPRPHTWITTAAGLVPNGATGQVWTVGRPCRWVCACPRCRHPRPEAAEVLAPGNPPARVRSTREVLALLAVDREPGQPPASRRATPSARPRTRRAPAEDRTTPDAPTLF